MNVPFTNPTILCVDDDADDQQLIVETVSETDQAVQVNCVKNGEEAIYYLQKAKQHTLPSLILLDINMPGRNGKATLLKIKEDPQLRQIPVVMFTTSADQRDIDFCLGHGAAAFITKPLSQEELKKAVENFLRFMKS